MKILDELQIDLANARERILYIEEKIERAPGPGEYELNVGAKAFRDMVDKLPNTVDRLESRAEHIGREMVRIQDRLDDAQIDHRLERIEKWKAAVIDRLRKEPDVNMNLTDLRMEMARVQDRIDYLNENTISRLDAFNSLRLDATCKIQKLERDAKKEAKETHIRIKELRDDVAPLINNQMAKPLHEQMSEAPDEKFEAYRQWKTGQKTTTVADWAAVKYKEEQDKICGCGHSKIQHVSGVHCSSKGCPCVSGVHCSSKGCPCLDFIPVDPQVESNTQAIDDASTRLAEHAADVAHLINNQMAKPLHEQMEDRLRPKLLDPGEEFWITRDGDSEMVELWKDEPTYCNSGNVEVYQADGSSAFVELCPKEFEECTGISVHQGEKLHIRLHAEVLPE